MYPLWFGPFLPFNGKSDRFDFNQTASNSADSMPRQRSVALFVPRRTSLTPAEERAYFIMVESADNGTGGGVGAGSGKRLTVFSKSRRLLGFYEDVRICFL